MGKKTDHVRHTILTLLLRDALSVRLFMEADTAWTLIVRTERTVNMNNSGHTSKETHAQYEETIGQN